MRRTPVAIAAAVLLLAIAAVASAGPRDAELGRIAAEGPVTLSSNRPGVALLHAEHIKPGDHVTGLVSLSNKGDQPGVRVLVEDLRWTGPEPGFAAFCADLDAPGLAERADALTQR